MRTCVSRTARARLTPLLAGAPVETLHMTCAEVNSHLYQVHALRFAKRTAAQHG